MARSLSELSHCSSPIEPFQILHYRPINFKKAGGHGAIPVSMIRHAVGGSGYFHVCRVDLEIVQRIGVLSESFIFDRRIRRVLLSHMLYRGRFCQKHDSNTVQQYGAWHQSDVRLVQRER